MSRVFNPLLAWGLGCSGFSVPGFGWFMGPGPGGGPGGAGGGGSGDDEFKRVLEGFRIPEGVRIPEGGCILSAGWGLLFACGFAAVGWRPKIKRCLSICLSMLYPISYISYILSYLSI